MRNTNAAITRMVTAVTIIPKTTGGTLSDFGRERSLDGGLSDVAVRELVTGKNGVDGSGDGWSSVWTEVDAGC